MEAAASAPVAPPPIDVGPSTAVSYHHHAPAARTDQQRAEDRNRRMPRGGRSAATQEARAIEKRRRFLHADALVIGKQQVVHGLARERGVLAQVTLGEDRSAERREVITLERFHDALIEAQRIRRFDEAQSLALARRAQSCAGRG
jgi:hypothetical protein